ncbi:hypothetical protein AX17_003852 [Amanita inopinata Kibby_2008]|nr:hypothetical protein AX17_003852 [Amanita inopinata Kibby_2008]
MAAMNASRLMACTLLLSLPSTAFARPGDTALIRSIDKANLVSLLIFAVISFLQLGHAAFALFYKRTAEQDYRFRVPFVLIMVLTLSTSIIGFVVEAVIEFQIKFGTRLNHGVYAAAGFMEEVALILLYAGLLLLLAYRRSAQISPRTGQPVGFTTFGLIEGFVVGILLLFMLVYAIARAAIPGMPLHKHTHDLSILSNSLYRSFLAVSIVLALIIGFDSISLWVKRDEASSPFHLVLFDNNVLLPMAALIWPLLMVRALFDLAGYLVLSFHITLATYSSILLARLLTRGSTQVIVIALALMFGFSLFKRNIQGKGLSAYKPVPLH